MLLRHDELGHDWNTNKLQKPSKWEKSRGTKYRDLEPNYAHKYGSFKYTVKNAAYRNVV